MLIIQAARGGRIGLRSRGVGDESGINLPRLAVRGQPQVRYEAMAGCPELG